MRVLLLHEMSGVHSHLRAGLRELGVEADVATFGDLSRGFATDVYLGPTSVGVPGSIARGLRQLQLAPRFLSYDIVQTISTTPFNPIASRTLLWLLRHSRVKLVFLGAGSDALYRQHARSLAYWPPHDWFINEKRYAAEHALVSQAAGVVTMAWDYSYTLRAAGFHPHFIPPPVDLTQIEPVYPSSTYPLVVYHPLNRKEGNDFKATSLVRAAFARLKDKYGDKVQFVEKGRMTYAEYVEFTKKVHVIVDQFYSQGYGMSTLLGLCQGKAVVCGLSERTKEFDVYRDAPVIHADPNVDSIAAAIARVVDNPQRLPELGRAGRAHAEKYHSAPRVAQQYLDFYRQLT